MIFTQTPLQGAFVIKIEPFQDDRGFFARTFCENEFSGQNLNTKFIQANQSGTRGKGVVRGMHFQKSPFEEVKLVKCIQGAIFDVIVDVRPNSPTYLQWFGTELSAENKEMIYIPHGFAHGFQALTEYTEITYLVSEYYNKASEGGINALDPSVNIHWPLPIALRSDKDCAIPFVKA